MTFGFGLAGGNITIGIISNKCYGERKKKKYILEIVRYLKTRVKK